MNRTIASQILVAISLATLVAPSATRAHHDMSPERLIGAAKLEQGRAAFTKELTTATIAIEKSKDANADAISKRKGHILSAENRLADWADAETRALHTGASRSMGNALIVLETSMLGISEKFRAERVRLDADAAIAKIPMEWPDPVKDRLPLALARLAKKCGSLDDIERVFQDYGGIVGDLTDPARFFQTDLDWDAIFPRR